METASKMSLAALQQQDPYINKLLDVTGQVALYTFNSKANEWEKTEIEGTLFVYARSASPRHGFTIMNRLSTENLIEPINKDLEFQLQDPFLLYRNANLGIYSIWFYDKKDCQRITQLMVKIVKQEALLAHRETPETVMAPAGTNGCTEPRPIDILELLSKAKDEYHRAQTSEIEMSFTGDPVMTPEMMKTASETTDVALSTPQPEKTAHSGQRQITVEELFGSSLPRESGLLPAMPTQTSIEPGSPGPNSYLQAQSYTPVVPFKPLLAPCLATDPLGNNRHPVMETRGNHGYTQELSPMFPSGPPQDPRSQQPGSSLLVVLSGAETGSPSTYLGQDLLGCLKPSPSDLHKPTLAPCFLTSPLATPQSFREPIPKPAGHCNVPTAPVQLKNKEQDMFSQSNKLSKPMLTGLGVLGAGPSLTGAGPSLTGAGPSLTEAGPSLTEAGPSLTGAELSVLLSPSAFQQSVVKVTSPPRQVAPPSPTSTAPPPCNRTQLQDTLVHLIKNDPVFLSAIHEAYLQSLSKDLGNIKL